LEKFRSYLISFLILILLVSVSSCAIHPRFPYICFRKSCVLGQLGITAAMNAGKVKRKEIKGTRKRRQIKRDAKRNRAETEGTIDKPRIHETHEEREARRKDEKAAAKLAEEQNQKKEDSLSAIAYANKAYINPSTGQNQETRTPESKQQEEDSLIIYYDVNTFELSLPDKEKLNRYLESLSKTNYSKLRISGYTDNSGVFSKERVEKIEEFLLQKGLPKNKLILEDKGSKNPSYSNQTDDGRHHNRRVVILKQ
jgi:outer membrane protein OmpA-like peptidoglycan-associated protein